jgi:putative addiction module component (TIGR02574 family)
MNIQELEAELLKLSGHDRARLAERLLASLGPDDESARAWADDAELRGEQLRSGEVQAIPAEEVFARLRAQLP